MAGLYNVCYVNAFQTQPDEWGWWQARHRRLLLARHGRPILDRAWNEQLLDTSTRAKRRALLRIVGGWIDGCARAGYQAVEPDNLDSWDRSHGGLTRADNLAFASRLIARAHARGLAIAQKNAAEVAPIGRRLGFDFAVAEECQPNAECDAYLRAYGNEVIEIEYPDNGGAQNFAAACRARGARISISYRDRDVTPAGRRGHLERTCNQIVRTAGSPVSLPRLASSDLAYRGAFLLPAQVSDRKTFAYGGTALAYNPAHHSLFSVGHDWYQLTAEVTIPRPVRSSRLHDLRRARFRQPFADATSGKIDATGGVNNKVGGQLVYGGRLYGSVYVYYDAAGSQIVSHWTRRSTSLTGTKANGLYRVGRLGAGLVSGFMAEVPPQWRRLLGGPALTGNCCIPIISRTSFGPAAFAFDPARLGVARPVPDTPLVYYPQEHPTLGAWDATWNPAKGVFFGGGTTIRGLVFPRGTRSVLFFGTQGTGTFCYGEGTDRQSLAGTPTPDGTTWCYDPDDSSKGTHAYPYVPEVWAYDAAELLAVRRGRKRPWQAKPYATWELKLPFGSGRIGGAAYDPIGRLIYVSQQYGNGTEPVIHVFKVS